MMVGLPKHQGVTKHWAETVVYKETVAYRVAMKAWVRERMEVKTERIQERKVYRVEKVQSVEEKLMGKKVEIFQMCLPHNCPKVEFYFQLQIL